MWQNKVIEPPNSQRGEFAKKGELYLCQLALLMSG
jgi:hypothetical protein